MVITPIAHGLELGISTAPRSEGVHMSTIYNSLYQGLEPKRFKKGTAPDPLRLELGLAFEAILEEGLRRRINAERPNEFRTEEGIAFSPDLLIYNGAEGNDLRVGEIKLTWLSSSDVPRKKMRSNGFPPKFDKWLNQVKLYCRALETRLARVYAFFVNGTYKPMMPELLAWDIEFSQRELDEAWALNMNHARDEGLLIG